MLAKCPLDPYAYYDQWGNRYLVLSHRDYVWAARRAAGHLLTIFFLR